MDLPTVLRKLQRSIASMAVVAIVASLSVASSVSAFSDVPEDAWYYANVQELVDAEIVDGSAAKFNPAANLNRAEAAKIVVKAAGVDDEDLVKAPVSSFKDVKLTDWFSPYVETAKSLGFVGGYPDGTFGGAKNVNRAEFAKMMTLALELEASTKVAPFSDVKSTDWFYGVVNTAYNWSVVDGEAGKFNPGRSINRAEMSKMVVAAMAGEERTTTPGGTTPPGTTPPAATGDVNVAMAGAQGEVTLTKGSVGNTVLSFSINSGVDTTLNSLKFSRTGVGLSTDYSNVYVYDGATRLKSGKSITADTNTVEFTNLGIALQKGVVKTLALKADVYTSAGTGDINYMNIISAADVGVSAGTVKGTFPVTGTKVTIGSQSIGTTTVENNSSVAKPVIGQSVAKLANVKITAGNNDVEVSGLTLTQNGSFANTGLANFILKYAGDSIATAAKMTGDKVVLTFAKPFAISKNQNRTLELFADLSGGKTTDTIRFYLEESTDIIVLDKQYSQNSAITNSFGSTAAYCVGAASNTCGASGSLQGGAVTLSDQGPAATNVKKNATGVTLFKFNLTSSRNVTVKDYYLSMEQTAWDGSTAVKTASATITAGAVTAAGALTGLTLADEAGIALNDVLSVATDDGTMLVKVTNSASPWTGTVIKTTTTGGVVTYGATTTANTNLANDAVKTAVEVYDNHLKTYVKNVKLVDLDTNNTLASAANSDSILTLSDDFDIAAGQTRKLAIKADLDNSLVAANAFKSGVDFTVASTIKDNDANQYVSASDVVAGNTVGKVMTVAAASLTVTRASTPVSTTVVKGVQGVELLGLSLGAGSSSDVKLTQLTVRVLADDDNTFDNGEGDTAANAVVDSVYLYEEGSLTPLAGPKALTLVGTIGSDDGYYKATFDGLSYLVKAGMTPKIVVKVNVKNTLSATRYLAATVVGASDVTAQDMDGNVLVIANTADGGVGENDGGTVGNDTTPAVTLTVATSGGLTASVEGSPSSAIVVAGATNVAFGKYKLSATSEAYVVDKLTVIGDVDGTFGTASSAADNNVVRIGVRYTDANGVTQTSWSNLVSGVADFSGLTLFVPKDSSSYVDIIADMNTVAGGATSGATPRFGLSVVQSTANKFNAVGSSSSETKTYTAVATVAGESNVNAMTVRKSTPTVAKAGSSASLINGENTLFSFTAAADAKGGVALRRVVLNTSFVADITVNGLRFYRGATDITSNVSIRNKAGQNLKTGGSDLVLASGSATSDVVYIDWDKASTDEETISAGTTNTYTLKGTISAVEAADSFSAYIADDSTAGTATSTSTGVASWRTSTASSGENADGSINATRTVWRWASSTSIYLDTNGTGDYEAASDFLLFTYGTGDSAYTVDQVIPGAMRYDGADPDAGASGNSLVYWDLNGDGNYVLGDDISAAIIEDSDTAVSDDALVVSTLRYDSTRVLYIDVSGANYAADADHTFQTDAAAAADITAPTTAPTANSEVWSSNTNFIWSDLSNTSHTTSTVDWANGYNVSDLATASNTLSL